MEHLKIVGDEGKIANLAMEIVLNSMSPKQITEAIHKHIMGVKDEASHNTRQG